MTSRSYFDKMNSTLGSVVPLAMFYHYGGVYNVDRAGDDDDSPVVVMITTHPSSKGWLLELLG